MTNSVEVRITTEKRRDIWDEVREHRSEAIEAEKLWFSLDEGRRASVVSLVRDTLKQLENQVEGWLPTALESSNGDWVSMNIKFEFPEVTDAVAQHWANFLTDRAAALADTIAIEEQLR